jgi:dethiobiotin synthetase
VEGVGGLLVPLTLGYLVRDFARDLGLPIVIAAHPGLGTINHTLLTIEAARGVGLEVALVALTPWPGDPSVVQRSNRDAIERLGSVQVEPLPELDLAAPESWPTLRLGD